MSLPHVQFNTIPNANAVNTARGPLTVRHRSSGGIAGDNGVVGGAGGGDWYAHPGHSRFTPHVAGSNRDASVKVGSPFRYIELDMSPPAFPPH